MSNANNKTLSLIISAHRLEYTPVNLLKERAKFLVCRCARLLQPGAVPAIVYPWSLAPKHTLHPVFLAKVKNAWNFFPSILSIELKTQDRRKRK
jgi:hypothetical protein